MSEKILFVCGLMCFKNSSELISTGSDQAGLYYDQAQSSQHPKRGTASTQLVLQSFIREGSIRNEAQAASETRHSQY